MKYRVHSTINFYSMEELSCVFFTKKLHMNVKTLFLLLENYDAMLSNKLKFPNFFLSIYNLESILAQYSSKNLTTTLATLCGSIM